MSDIFIGRQPIYDRKLGVYAYELLFRSEQSNAADITDGDKATSDVIVNAFLEIGLDNRSFSVSVQKETKNHINNPKKTNRAPKRGY